MKNIKYLQWEGVFLGKINRIRKQEFDTHNRLFCGTFLELNQLYIDFCVFDSVREGPQLSPNEQHIHCDGIAGLFDLADHDFALSHFPNQ